LGLSIESFDHSDFLKDGEVGDIVSRALSLYAALLEANNPTARFMQALSLLEFFWLTRVSIGNSKK